MKQDDDGIGVRASCRGCTDSKLKLSSATAEFGFSEDLINKGRKSVALMNINCEIWGYL